MDLAVAKPDSLTSSLCTTALILSIQHEGKRQKNLYLKCYAPSLSWEMLKNMKFTEVCPLRVLCPINKNLSMYLTPKASSSLSTLYSSYSKALNRKAFQLSSLSLLKLQNLDRAFLQLFSFYQFLQPANQQMHLSTKKCCVLKHVMAKNQWRTSME